MFSIFKRNKKADNPAQEEEALICDETPLENINSQDSSPISQEPSQKGFFSRLTKGLKRTRGTLTEGLAKVILGKKVIDAALFEEIETQLLQADVGVEATQTIIKELTDRSERKLLKDAEALYENLQEQLTAILSPVNIPLQLTAEHKPFVILMVGVNGSGKTTTIGKLAHHFQQQGKKVMLAAGDTFRAAAIEQLQIWGERNNIPVIAQQQGSDSASVIFDAYQAAKAKGVDVLIADTAGRLHTQNNLMEELKKVRRVLTKIDASAPHEVMLVLDGGVGQNALVQAQQFQQAVTVTGLTLTKLDGTAKGGIIFAIAKKLGIPLRFIGVGETLEDLREFNAEEFVSALFNEQHEKEDHAAL